MSHRRKKLAFIRQACHPSAHSGHSAINVQAKSSRCHSYALCPADAPPGPPPQSLSRITLPKYHILVENIRTVGLSILIPDRSLYLRPAWYSPQVQRRSHKPYPYLPEAAQERVLGRSQVALQPGLSHGGCAPPLLLLPGAPVGAAPATPRAPVPHPARPPERRHRLSVPAQQHGGGGGVKTTTTEVG